MPKIAQVAKKLDNYMGLFIGRPGKGKSVAAASFPKPLYIFDFDGRIKAVANAFGDEDIDYDTYAANEFPKVYKKLEELVLNCRYQTVVFDSYTSYADMMIEYSIGTRGAGSSGSAAKDEEKTKGRNKGLLEMTVADDYNAETRGIQKLIMMMRMISAPYKIMTAHMLITEYYNMMNPGATRLMKSVLTAGKKVTEKVPGYFDEVYYFQTKDNPTVSKGPLYVCRTIPEEEDTMKTTLPLPHEINFTKRPENPSGSFYKEIQNHLKMQGWQV
jgi:hypothetical protein